MGRKRRTRSLRKYEAYIVGTLAGGATGIVLVLLSALIMTALSITAEWAAALAVTSLIASALVSGYVTGRLKKRNGIATGAKCALVLFSACFFGALVCGRLEGGQIVPRLFLMVAGGVFGAVLGVNGKRRV